MEKFIKFWIKIFFCIPQKIEDVNGLDFRLRQKNCILIWLMTYSRQFAAFLTRFARAKMLQIDSEKSNSPYRNIYFKTQILKRDM